MPKEEGKVRGVRGFIAVLSAWAPAFSAGAAIASPYATTTPKRAMTGAAQAARLVALYFMSRCSTRHARNPQRWKEKVEMGDGYPQDCMGVLSKIDLQLYSIHSLLGAIRHQYGDDEDDPANPLSHALFLWSSAREYLDKTRLRWMKKGPGFSTSPYSPSLSATAGTRGVGAC